MLAAVAVVALDAIVVVVAVIIVVVVFVFVDATPFAAIVALLFTLIHFRFASLAAATDFIASLLIVSRCAAAAHTQLAQPNFTSHSTFHAPNSYSPLQQATGRLSGCLVPSQKRKSYSGNIQQSLLLLSYPFPSLQGVAYLAGPVPKTFSLALPCLAEIN